MDDRPLFRFCQDVLNCWFVAGPRDAKRTANVAH